MSSAAIQVCNDTSEAVELCKARGIYLKPLAKLTICVRLPTIKNPTQSVSNWEVQEKLKKMARPHEFLYLKIMRATMDFIRFEAEVENRSTLKSVLNKLDATTMKHAGFPEPFKIKAAEAKSNFPTRHDWDSFYRDAKNMNEMKPGERPDTIYFSNLPIKWFSDNEASAKPSERILKEIFETLGEIRFLDIPMLDPYRKNTNKSVGFGLRSFSQELVFEAYVQFKEYIGFVKAMESLRGMKLVKSIDGKAHVASIIVDFDKTKHLSLKNIKRRMIERQRLIALEKKKELNEEQDRQDKNKEEELSLKEEKRQKREQYRQAKDRRRQLKMVAYKKAKKTAIKQRKELVLRRRKEASALLAEFLESARKTDIQEKMEAIEKERIKQLELEEKKKLAEITRQADLKRVREENLRKREEALREKLLLNLKVREEKRTEEMREKLRGELAGRKVLKSVLGTVESRDNRAMTPAIKSFYQFPVRDYQEAKRNFYKRIYAAEPFQYHPPPPPPPPYHYQPQPYHHYEELYHQESTIPPPSPPPPPVVTSNFGLTNGGKKKVHHKKTCPRYNKFKTERVQQSNFKKKKKRWEDNEFTDQE